MDTFDRRIIAALQRDGRGKLSDLSALVGLSPTPLARRIARLEGHGIITGYAARIDQEKLGLPLNAFVFVELARRGQGVRGRADADAEHPCDAVELCLAHHDPARCAAGGLSHGAL